MRNGFPRWETVRWWSCSPVSDCQCLLRVLLSSVWRQHVIQKQSKVVPLHTTKPYWGNRGLAPLTLNPALYGGKWSTSNPGSFNLWKVPRYPKNRRQGRPQNRFGRFGEKTTTFSKLGFETRTVQPVEKTHTKFWCWDTTLWSSRCLVNCYHCSGGTCFFRSGHFSCPQYGGSTRCLLT